MHTPTLFEVVNRTLWQCLALGTAAVAFVPAARGMSTIGWWPYWLVIAPAVGLLVLHRQRVAAMAGVRIFFARRGEVAPLRTGRSHG
ncbi:hypothetical protein [Arenimonas composti]|uniref:Uncharacterized protein n=1 Tax=Arenimonas composti TR7-09 = DSM 18010 TaxID=1121013 RepID=A0A091BAX8_9GAMM|nr:hypothetical protein [Arenimonas composti]KFN49823.1 hypothetical protein P873_08865 [Arenimonas composti TR7-09 = DSM 18010]